MSVPASLALRRDLDILEGLGNEEVIARRGIGVVRLAHAVGRDKSQVSRALRALQVEGLVERDADSLEYRLGWRLYALAARTTSGRLLHVAQPALRHLAARLRETAHLCVLHDQEVLTVLSQPPANTTDRHAQPARREGRRVAIETTSAGRVLLMDLDERELASRFQGKRPRPSEANRRIRTMSDFYAATRHIHAEGFALVDDELDSGSVGVSAPVRDLKGQVIAAISVAAPRERMGPGRSSAGRACPVSVAELACSPGFDARGSNCLLRWWWSGCRSVGRVRSPR
jgi:IclR family KDG regulon transcriptional repressor